MKISIRLIQKKVKVIGHFVKNIFGSFVVGRKQIAADRRVNSVLKWLKMFGYMGRRMTVYLQQVKGSRGSFVLVLARRDGRARESLNRKGARERRQSTEWEVMWDLELRWRREPWTEGRTPSASSGGRVGTDVATLGWMLGSCGHF